MPIIYLSGSSGAGKSTICNMLSDRGYETYDLDDNGLTTWYNLKTGRPVDWHVADRKDGWYEKHGHRLNVTAVRKIADKVKDETVLLCGTSGLEVKDLFSKIIYLDIDADTMIDRVTSRTTNKFGKDKAEQEIMLHWHQIMKDLNREAGAVFVDAKQPLDVVLHQVIAEVSN